MMKRLIATAALTSLAASAAHAQSTYAYNPEAGPYLGAGIGHAMLDNDTMDWLDDIGASTDDNDVGYKLYAGYQFNPHFAIEASYLDFGDFTAEGTLNGERASGKASADGFGAALVGRLPIQGGFSLHAKLGMIAWDGNVSGSYFDGNSRVSDSYSDDGTDPFYGVGTEYVVNQLVMRAEYERYDISESGEDFEIDMLSGSLGYRF